MIFANVKGLTIPGGDVKKIVYGETTLWEANVLPEKKPLAQMAWADIKTIADVGHVNSSSQWCVNGDSDVWFEIGDEKDITLTGGEILTVMIYGFSHDDKVGGGKAGITFGLKNLMASSWQMNTTGTNAGGWDQSYMRNTTLPAIFATLPSDLRSSITEVYKKATAGEKSKEIVTSSDKLWLFANAEVINNTDEGYKDEGTKYPAFTDNASRKKYALNGAGAVQYWWLRSPVTGATTGFRTTDTLGAVTQRAADTTSYTCICFGFCI